jgi:hypothetical protein
MVRACGVISASRLEAQQSIRIEGNWHGLRLSRLQTPALRTTVNILASEMAEPMPESDLVVSRLADVLFIQCLRAAIGSLQQWLAASHFRSANWFGACSG